MPNPPVMAYTEYDPAYPAVFDQLVRDVHAMVGRELRVEHVGSTAVPGLGGRRVIDAVIVESDPAERSAVTATLLGGGFTASPFGWLEPTLTRVVTVDERSYPLLLYVLSADHPVLRGWLASREHWRAHPDEAARYAAVKRRAIAEGHVQPWTYQQAKTPYLEQLAAELGSLDTG